MRCVGRWLLRAGGHFQSRTQRVLQSDRAPCCWAGWLKSKWQKKLQNMIYIHVCSTDTYPVSSLKIRSCPLGSTFSPAVATSFGDSVRGGGGEIASAMSA